MLIAGGCESRAKIQPCLCQKMKMPCYWFCFLDFLPLLFLSFCFRFHLLLLSAHQPFGNSISQVFQQILNERN